MQRMHTRARRPRWMIEEQRYGERLLWLESMRSRMSAMGGNRTFLLIGDASEATLLS
jgi:hypothetical protein